MNLIVDLHIHSHYSRATSSQSNLEGLYKWGKIKGINIIGTGDFTHPKWFAELREKLEPAENGLYKLKEEFSQSVDALLSESVRNNVIRFVLTVEISNIYAKHGKVRKLHNIIVVPDFDTAAKINGQLERIGNLKADGRPILGIDSKDLLKVTLDSHPDALLVPAHIWTPWFGMFGSKSGFDTIQESFEDLTPEIKAIETGLSSDPYMNWQLSRLDGLTVISNSDAHSPQKLGREANIINAELSYQEIINAIKTNDHRFVGTIEFFPEEGKYHSDGHRACKIRFTPKESKQHNGMCPVCYTPLTIGVDNRVSELADRTHGYTPANIKTVEYIIPLPEIIAELNGIKSTTSKKVEEQYQKVCTTLGDEFSILRTIPIQTIKDAGFTEVAQAIHRMRKRDVYVAPGYDGVYGTIRIYRDKEDMQKKNKRYMS